MLLKPNLLYAKSYLLLTEPNIQLDFSRFVFVQWQQMVEYVDQEGQMLTDRQVLSMLQPKHRQEVEQMSLETSLPLLNVLIRKDLAMPIGGIGGKQ